MNQNNKEVCTEAIEMIVSFEKMHRVGSDGRVYPYHDAVGYPTIGIGHLLSKIVYEPLAKYGSMTIQEAQELHHTDLNIFAAGICQLVSVDLTDNQFGALVSLSFNIGLENFKSSTLLKKLNFGYPVANVSPEFLKWNRARGKVLNGLTRRRIAEQKLFLKK
jgi:lysozyme